MAELTKFKRSMVSQNKSLQESLETEKTKLVSTELHLSTSLSLNNANQESISELRRKNEDLLISKDKYRADLKSEDAKKRELKSELAECKTQLSKYEAQGKTHDRDKSELQAKVEELTADAARTAEEMEKANGESRRLQFSEKLISIFAHLLSNVKTTLTTTCNSLNDIMLVVCRITTFIIIF